MTKETLQQAKEINEQIDKLHAEIAELQRPGIIVRLYSDETTFTVLSTIGTDGRCCEHPDWEAARWLLATVIARRQNESSALHAKFNSL